FLTFFFRAEDGIRDATVTGVQTCALPIFRELGREVLGDRPGRVGRRVVDDRDRRREWEPRFEICVQPPNARHEIPLLVVDGDDDVDGLLFHALSLPVTVLAVMRWL